MVLVLQGLLLKPLLFLNHFETSFLTVLTAPYSDLDIEVLSF